MSNLGGFFFPLWQGDGCAQIDRMDSGQKLVHMKNLPKWSHVAPPSLSVMDFS